MRIKLYLLNASSQPLFSVGIGNLPETYGMKPSGKGLLPMDYGCLPLDCPCYMLGKCWTGAYCRYFRETVLPLDPVLEKGLTAEGIAETRPCPICGRAFFPDGRQRYCSPACAGAALREQKRDYMRRKRR